MLCTKLLYTVCTCLFCDFRLGKVVDKEKILSEGVEKFFINKKVIAAEGIEVRNLL